LVSELEAKGGVVIPFPAATKNPLAMIRNVMRLRALCAQEKIDIIHARSRAPAWSAFFAARLSKIPFVTTYHGSYSGSSFFKVCYNSIMARGDVVIANSYYTASLIERLHPFARSHLRVIHRGTDLQLFSKEAVSKERREALREAWGVDADYRIILLAARLTGWKGQRVLIRAARRLVEQGFKDFVVILAGDAQGRDAYVSELKALIQELALEDHVRIVGHCADMPAAFSLADIVAVPSTEPEAFGRSAVEAQALGTPVVVSDLGAVPETVLAPPECDETSRTGWRVPAGDHLALAKALADCLSLTEDAKTILAVRARAHVEAHFSLPKMVQETLSLYGRLLNPL
jgi:glycosyltransferase involved in cell wall biosynthesis